MFDFITEEHEAIQLAARDFSQREIAPIAAEFDESGEFPLESYERWVNWASWGLKYLKSMGGRHGHDGLCFSHDRDL